MSESSPLVMETLNSMLNAAGMMRKHYFTRALPPFCQLLSSHIHFFIRAAKAAYSRASIWWMILRANSQMERITKKLGKPLKLDNIQHIKYHTSPRNIYRHVGTESFQHKVHSWKKRRRRTRSVAKSLINGSSVRRPSWVCVCMSVRRRGNMQIANINN